MAFANMERPPEEKAFGISPYKVQPRRRGAQLFSLGASKIARVGPCAVQGVLILAGANPAR